MKQEAQVQVLDINTSNQIAAGEVVEKPASVVKELVENSIDAGADSIDVTIYQGGVEYIRIADNGSGMSQANAKLALRRHATSKLRKAEDLLHLHTLGFRGEALPSIASVSNFELLTRPAAQELATSIKVSGGSEQECMETGGPLGTTIIVRDLFFNVPARRKFLKTNSTEGRYISELLTRMALAHPEVRLKLTNNDKEVLATPGTGDLKATINALYGKKVATELLPISFKGQDLQVEGYIGKPTLLKGNRSWQTILVNGRIISNMMISKAIEHAYQSQIPKSGFPFAVLNIMVDTTTVDINVHPQKSELKFSDESLVYKGVFKALTDALTRPMQAAKQANALTQSQRAGQEPEGSQLRLTNTANTIKGISLGRADGSDRGSLAATITASFSPRPNEEQEQRPKSRPLPDFDSLAKKQESIWKTPEVSPDTAMAPIPEAGYRETGVISSGIQEEGVTGPSEFAVTAQQPNSPLMAQDRPIDGTAVLMQAAGENGLDTIWPLGQVDRTFIIAQSENALYLIDQHAAHERILFDRLMQSHNSIPAQQLLIPIYVDVQTQEVELIEAHQEEFARLGVDIAPGGESVLRISSLPVDITPDSAEDFVRAITRYLRDHKNPEPNELRQEVLHTTACKAAIKAGQVLNLRQMRQLLIDLCNTTHPFTCPHGRPCMLELTSEELYSMFKRTGFNIPKGDKAFWDRD